MSTVATLIQGIDLFAGAGGLSLGAHLAGISVSHAIEENKTAASTYRANHSSTKVIEEDVRKVPELKFRRGAVKILFGGPPCQGFSTSNQRTRSTNNPKNWLFAEFFRFAKASSPDWIVLENVKGLRETAQGQFEKLILSELQELGYSTGLWLLCAAEYGVPQRRHRLFFVGSRKGSVPFPPQSIPGRLVSVRDAIWDLPTLVVGANVDELKYRCPPASEYAAKMRGDLRRCSGHLVTHNNDIVKKRYPFIPQGGNWQNIPKRLMQNYTNLVNSRSRHTGIYRRLHWEQPSVVIANYRKNMLVHPDQDRGLSVREASRIQSFPDWYQFSGSIGLRQQQVSNAVPPLLAKAVFEHILKFI